MKKPFRIAKIFGKDVPIYKVQGMVEEGTYGLYEPNRKVICLDEGLTGEQERAVAIHEIFHAILDRLYIRLPDQIEEIVIENLTTGLLDNFKVSWK